LIAPSPGAWQESIRTISWHPPTLQLQILWDNRSDLFPWLGVIVPMGLFNVIGSLQNLESADAAGDRYATRTCLLIDGVGTLAAAALGSCFPTTIYIGHSGFKEMGARSGYSWLNGVVMAAACFFGLFGLLALLIPIDAGMSIVLYIGIAMTAQAFQATPARHAPAVVLGLLPGLAGWGAQLLKAGLRAGGLGTPIHPFNQQMIDQLAQGDVWAAGAFALEQGQIITAMLLAALLVFAIEGRFLAAATCSGIAAVLAWFGVIHAWQFSSGDTVVNLGWGTGEPWAIAYALITVLILIARRLPQQSEGT
jgi:AGZA family xanthine/uracil permease-like MFS transporter